MSVGILLNHSNGKRDLTVFPNTDFTWTPKSADRASVSSSTSSSIVLTSYWNNGTSQYACVVSQQTVKMDRYKTMTVIMTTTKSGTGGNYLRIGIDTSSAKNTGTSTTLNYVTEWNADTSSVTANVPVTLTLDVSDVKGDYYIYAGFRYGGSNWEWAVDSIVFS